ncbi:MAG: hypothetical protein WDN04_09895 [Rhodospirillales bacterium]
MPRQLLLHIGVPKTGTTSIQRALSAERAALSRHGVCYLAGPGLPVPQFLHRAALAHGRRDTRMARFRHELGRQLAAQPADVGTVLLSAEQCSLFLRSPAEIECLRAWLAPLFETIRIIIYLRRQDALASSLYAQMLRRGVVEPPALDTGREELSALYDYATLLERWAAVFGRAALVPRIFERQSLPGGDVVQDFWQACGLAADLPERRAGTDINPSMSTQGQALLLEVGRMLQAQGGTTPVRDAAWTRLAAMVTELYPGRGWQPSRTEAASFMARYEAGNEAVRGTWFPDRSRLFNADGADLPEAPVSLENLPTLETASSVLMRALRDLIAAEAAIEGDSEVKRNSRRLQRMQRERSA